MGDKESEFVARYLSTKHHTWRGKYKRIFCVGNNSCATINPGNWDVSNQWCYPGRGKSEEELVDIVPLKATNEFQITLRKAGGRKTSTMKFSSDHRPEILTDAQKFRHIFAVDADAKAAKFQPVQAVKYHWSEREVETLLHVTPFAIQQLSTKTRNVTAEYLFKDIQAISSIDGVSGGFVVHYGDSGRMHAFNTMARDQVIKAAQSMSQMYIGFNVIIRKPNANTTPITLDYFRLNRLGKWGDDISIMSLSEFNVYKVRPERHADPVPRVFGITERCIVEHDPGSYNIVAVRAFVDVYAIHRDQSDVQLFTVEYVDGTCRSYTSPDRDPLLASLLDGVRAAGNRRVAVNMRRTVRGQRVGPLGHPVDEEIEALYLKTLAGFHGAQVAGITFDIAVERFNVNVDFSGLRYSETSEGFFAQNKEKLINDAILALLNNGGKSSESDSFAAAAQFQALRRLAASRAGFMAFTEMPGFKQQLGKRVVHTLKHYDEGAIHAAVDLLGALMNAMVDLNDPTQEQLNKAALLQSKGFLQKLIGLLKEHTDANSGALVVNALLDFIMFALCPPYSETTGAEAFDELLEIVADLGRSLFKLFKHKSMAIIKGAGMIMRAIIEEGLPEIGKRMQYAALTEGSLLQHLHTSMFTIGTDWRHYQHRELSRHLVGLWLADNDAAVRLMSQCVPVGLLGYLESTEEPPPDKDIPKRLQEKNDAAIKHGPSKLYSVWSHWRTKIEKKVEEKTKGPRRPVVMRRRRKHVVSTSNWPMFFYQVRQDHARADLIWNHHTREEMRENFENEVRAFNHEKELSGGDVDVSWNYPEFEIIYQSLSDELKIGDIYLRLLLEDGGSEIEIREPANFFNDLYHRYLLATSQNMRGTCLQALALVYRKCWEGLGPFSDTGYIVTMLDRSTDKQERDRLLLFLEQLLLHRVNAKRFIDANGVRVLVDLATLAHLHTERAQTPLQSNVLEAGGMDRQGELEWYYTQGKDTRTGPVTFADLRTLWEENKLRGDTKCWAQGLDAWKPLQDIGQLRWQIMATGVAVLNESQLAKTCLSMLIKVCEFYPNRDDMDAVIRPSPRIKRILSSALHLPHIVQLLLTFDPPIVERTAMLLNHIVADNPSMPSVYTTGVFFFALMYTGSNLLPIARLLDSTHERQAFSTEEQTSKKRSVLTPLLPEAMVSFLSSYGAERFSETFLGEFDTPEAIWNHEMRRLMIEKVALHISEFSPRLMSNVRAHYQYHPIPQIMYPELSRELFCGIYYLRHLTNEQKFPDWPIKEQVPLLQDTLHAWKQEVEKKPPAMNSDDAYEVLKLAKGESHDEHKVRKAYFKLAAKFHPDKNPDGREMFEKISKAYEFLSTRAADEVSDGPDPRRIVLILRTQSILFRRFPEVLEPYKYAGYPMLIKTIQMETADPELFAKPARVLAAAAELAYHTINTSALNAEELRRDGGIEVLEAAFVRCLEMVSTHSQPDDMPVQVCTHIALCFKGFGGFPESRERIAEMPVVVDNVVRCMFYQNCPKLATAAVQAVASLAGSSALQAAMVRDGALWHLLTALFNYDYTLDEGGVEASDDSNKQMIANTLAKEAAAALGRLSGYRDPPADLEGRPNPVVCAPLHALLTPYLCRKLAEEDVGELLKTITCNEETPYLIWNNGTRAELREYLERNAESKVRHGTQDDSLGAAFVYDQHRHELQVGGVFLRIFNDNPQFQLHEPAELATALLAHLRRKQKLHRAIEEGADVEEGCDPKDVLAAIVTELEASLKSLCYVVLNNAGTEQRLLDDFPLLFSFLAMAAPDHRNVVHLAMEAVAACSTNKECVKRISEEKLMVDVCLGLHSCPASHEIGLRALHALGANSAIVQELLHRGAPLHVLGMFCSSKEQAVREGAAQVFAKLAADKLHGPKLSLLLAKFLPKIYLDAMRENAETAVHMFEGAHENPELIWNEEARDKVKSVVQRMAAEWNGKLRENRTATFKLPDGFQNVYSELDGELFVGGVYVRLFNKQPNWSLRNPREFLVALLDKYVELVNKNPDEELLGELTTSIVGLTKSQQNMQQQVAALGHIPKIVAALRKPGCAKCCIEVLHQLADSQGCVETFSKNECIKELKALMEVPGQSGYVLGVTAETLKKSYERQLTVEKSNLVKQALACKLPDYLLSLLGGGLDHVEQQSGVKAHVVKCLKHMAADEAAGDAVQNILNASSVWAAFKDQRHDLFIQNQSAVGMLTAGPAVAGMLTAGSAGPVMPDKPPELTDTVEAQPQLLRKGL